MVTQRELSNRIAKKIYDARGMKETCLNCGKEDCNLASVGNVARINENNGCWIPKQSSEGKNK